MSSNRIVTLIDMDCFYCQVEEKINPSLKGKPIAVVQYNEWKGGGIIAVNYLARAKGVTRFMRGDEAKEKCPDIELPRVPCVRGKADISKYREAGKDVAHILQRFTPLLERASVDEAYMDITSIVDDRVKSYQRNNCVTAEMIPNTFVLGYDDKQQFIKDVYNDIDYNHEMLNFDQEHSLRLLVGAVVVSEIRAAVYENTGFRCSAGIAHNKIMSKLVCGMNKPNKQTVLPMHCVSTLFDSLPVGKIKSLGGKFGVTVCDILKISKMSELATFSEKELQKYFDEKNGSFLYNIARGIDHEPVTPRFTSKSIGCCKKFPGKTAILNLASLTHWLGELGDEIEERLKTDSLENSRYPTQMVVSFTKQLTNGKDVSCSRSLNIKKGDVVCGEFFAENSLYLIKKDSKPFSPVECQNVTDKESVVLSHPIKYLGISVGKFQESNDANEKSTISHFFFQNSSDNTNAKKISTNDSENLDINNIDIKNPKNDIENNTEDNDKRNNEIPTSSFSKKINHHASEESSSKRCPKGDVERNIKLDQQESFFMKYLKSDISSSVKNNTSNYNTNDLVNNNQHVYNNKINENIMENNGDSNDSEISIELEINQSRKISEDEIVIDNSHLKIPRPNLSRTFSEELDKIEHSDNSHDYCNKQEETTFVKCEECNKNIPRNEYSTHIDYHVALSLRQEERQLTHKPFTQSVSTKTKKSPCDKKLASKKLEKKTNNILNFFNKNTNNEDSNVPTELCLECKKNIKLSELAEHLDYHEAKKLSLELNSNISTVVLTQMNNKRKRDKNESKNKQKKGNQIKTINTFFNGVDR